MSKMVTREPRSAKSWAVASPMPEEPPVTMTTLSLNNNDDDDDETPSFPLSAALARSEFLKTFGQHRGSCQVSATGRFSADLCSVIVSPQDFERDNTETNRIDTSLKPVPEPAFLPRCTGLPHCRSESASMDD